MKSSILVAIAALLVMVSFLASGWALYGRLKEADDRRAQQASFNQRIREVSLNYCNEIEALKKANRDKAIEAYNNLDQTLRLLKLKKTPEIVRVAKEQRDRTLRSFAPDPCPRPA